MPDVPDHRIGLSADEMAVLFDLLGRWVEADRLRSLRPLVEHEAELWALNDLFCELERQIVPGVAGGLAGARDRIMAFHGSEPFPHG
jgi:hypothetical protein